MKNNQPVTNNQVTFKEGEFIVSTTDTKGRLTYVNRTFLDISGFTRDELIGENHHIVRHPDMPAAAFKSLWENLQADKPWTGAVKNRCKNGDYYWVRANVTPIREGNQVTGYMSVRTHLSNDQIHAAEQLYRNINTGKASLQPSLIGRYARGLKGLSIKTYLGVYAVLALGLIAATALTQSPIAITMGLSTLLLGSFSFFLGRHLCNPIAEADHALRQLAEGNFSAWTSIDREDELGKLLQSLASAQIRLGCDVNEARDQSRETSRLKEALDKVTANVMIADPDLNIIYMNDAVQKMMRTAESDIREDLPNFDSGTLLGTNIDDFHKNPAHQRGLLAGLAKTFESDLKLGGRTLKITANPVVNAIGDRLGTVVEWTDRTEELGIEEEIQNIVGAAQAGDLGQRISLTDKQGFFKRLSEGVNNLVDVNDRVISDTVEVLGAMAQGDLTRSIDADYEGAFGQLKQNINTTIEKFGEVVTEISSGAAEVLGGAQEIAQGNTDLSQRTEEQAASLEETASAMEQMTATVRQNSDSSNQANQLAGEARKQAEQGGEVVGNAIYAMGEITTSSNKIAEIIEVINEIAFQTNLLALNAAVEAARAGDQGRGFAVVASEVRNLAQRSAGASKEIKELIEDSITKVNEGSELVSQSGATLEQINTSVKKVSDIIAEIAAAGQEQSAGIEEVNKAISQMDEMTQQNAALVEQAAAASESVGDQAGGLTQLMDFFTTNNGTGSARIAPPMVEKRSADRPWQDQAPSTKPVAKPASALPAAKVASSGGDDEWDEF